MDRDRIAKSLEMDLESGSIDYSGGKAEHDHNRDLIEEKSMKGYKNLADKLKRKRDRSTIPFISKI